MDDNTIVVDNPLLYPLHIGKIFSTDYWGSGGYSGLYRPLTTLSYGLNGSVFGFNPSVFRGFNVLFHGLSCCLLFLFAATVGLTTIQALLAGSLYCVLPIHGETINIITGRADIFVAIFVFLGLYFDSFDSKRRPIVVTACFVAAILSKESGVVLLGLLALTDAFKKGSFLDSFRLRWRFYLWLIFVTFLWRVWVNSVHSQASSVAFSNILVSENPIGTFGPLTKLFAGIELQAKYLITIIFPVKLQLVYGAHDLATTNGEIYFVNILGIVGVIISAFVVLRFWPKQKIIGWSIPAYLVSSSVTGNFLVVISGLFAERFAYMPSGIVCIAIASVLPKQISRNYQIALIASFVIYCSWLASVAYSNNEIYSSEVKLFESRKENAAQNGRLWYYLGSAYLKQGNNYEGEIAFKSGIEKDPQFIRNYDELAQLYVMNGKYPEALAVSSKAIGLVPGRVYTANLVYALSLAKLGQIASAEVQLAELSRYKEIRNSPFYSYLLGAVEEFRGNTNAAMLAYFNALDVIVDQQTLSALVTYLLNQRQYEAAVEVSTRLIELSPVASHYNYLGTALALQGRMTEAVEAFKAADKLAPNDPRYKANLERALGSVR